MVLVVVRNQQLHVAWVVVILGSFDGLELSQNARRQLT